MRVLNRATPTLTWGNRFNGHLRGPSTLIPAAKCFDSGAVTTCFNELGLSWLGFETKLQLAERTLKPYAPPLRQEQNILVFVSYLYTLWKKVIRLVLFLNLFYFLNLLKVGLHHFIYIFDISSDNKVNTCNDETLIRITLTLTFCVKFKR